MIRESNWDAHLEGDAAGEVGLDDAGDDVDRRPLGGDDQVDADGPGQLGQAADGVLDLLAAQIIIRSASSSMMMTM